MSAGPYCDRHLLGCAAAADRGEICDSVYLCLLREPRVPVTMGPFWQCNAMQVGADDVDVSLGLGGSRN